VRVGQTVNGVLTLAAPAPAPNGAQIRLTSSNPPVAQIPASVTIPPGQTSVGFAGTASVAGNTTVTATLGTSTIPAALTVTAVKAIEKTTDKVADKATDKVTDKLTDKISDVIHPALKGETRET
jgi:hypothetical protein